MQTMDMVVEDGGDPVSYIGQVLSDGHMPCFHIRNTELDRVAQLMTDPPPTPDYFSGRVGVIE